MLTKYFVKTFCNLKKATTFASQKRKNLVAKNASLAQLVRASDC